jgi:hypothetical protein
MARPTLNLEIVQGKTFSSLITVKTSDTVFTDVTGYTFEGQARRTIGDPAILFSFTFTIQDQLTNTGEVLWSLAPEVTSAIALDGKNLDCFYDVEMVDTAGGISEIAQGKIKLFPEVTR